MGEATPTVSRDLPVPGEAPNLASRLFVLPFTPRHPASSSSLGLAFVPHKWTLVILRLERSSRSPISSLLETILSAAILVHTLARPKATEGHLHVRSCAKGLRSTSTQKHTNKTGALHPLFS